MFNWTTPHVNGRAGGHGNSHANVPAGQYPNPRPWRAALWRTRWLLIALAVALLVRLALPGVVGSVRTTSPAVVLTRAVQAGAELGPNDVTTVAVAAGLVPDGALADPAAAVGSRLAAALPAGMPLTPEVLLDQGVLAAAPAGTVAFPTRLSDPQVARLIRPGDHIDVYASAGATGSGEVAPAQELARGALVLEVPGAIDTEVAPGLVLLAVTEAEARLLGGASSWAVISAVVKTGQ
ncbi:MAG: SAF domain-containing protein [Bifidobacteriaceae bacterium]|jgi:Flp pilus assembly protein CpaB|nr:SAF domain-containing protein [Bifidobacteriaceae bacterium]